MNQPLPFSFTSMPVLHAPPLLYQFSQTAVAMGGQYEFLASAGRTLFTPDRPVNSTIFYYFRTLTSFADVDEADYAAAFVTVPTFRMFLEQDAGSSFFREGVQLGKYFQNEPFEYGIKPVRSNNRFRAYIEGTLNQTMVLAGKNSITITVTLAVQEINDQGFLSAMEGAYKP